MNRCELCVRRPRSEGGNETCPNIYQPVILAQNGLMVKESLLTAWPRHLTQYDGCPSFKPGDLRTRPKAPEGQMGLL